jgi:gas vesicle protein
MHPQEFDPKQLTIFFAGLLLGSLAGAAVMALFVPKSGKEIRLQIQKKAIDLREQTTSTVEGAVAKVRPWASQIKADRISDKTKVKQPGQDIVVEQLEQMSSTAETGKR